MIRFLFVTLFSLPFIVALSQDDFSTIYLWHGKGIVETAEFEMFINTKPVRTFKAFELIECKMFSEDSVTIDVLLNRKIFYTLDLDIKHGEKYYVYFWYKGFKKQLEILKESEVRQYFIDDPYYFKEKYQYIEVIEQAVLSQGTGFLINDQGHVLTNLHVVGEREKITIRGIKGDYTTALEASVVAIDRQNDLAVLKVNSKLVTFENPPYRIGSSSQVQKAESVYTLGYPAQSVMGQEIKITDGIINSLSGLKGSMSEFQFSAAIQPGNSGGPLVNKDGIVVGIVTSKLRTDIAESVSYAIKSDYVKLFLDQVGNVKYLTGESTLKGKELTEQVKLISEYVLIVEAE